MSVSVGLLIVIVLLVALKLVTRSYLLARKLRGPFMPFIVGNIYVMFKDNGALISSRV